MRHQSVRRRLAATLALLVAAAGLAFAAPAHAAPGDTGDDGEGGSKSLIQQLEAASRGYVQARDALAASKTRQAQLTARLKQLDAELAPRQAAVDEIVAEAYMSGRLGPMSALLNAGSGAGFLDRAEMLETVGVKQQAAVTDLRAVRDQQAAAKLAIDATIRDQQKQVNVMAKRKVQAETALKAANAGQDDPQPSDGGSSKSAAKFQGGSGMVDDPTSGGRITQRMLFAMRQAQADGFTHYVHCWREQNSGEHPKGRACDFAADKGGFGGVATGASKTYGTNLANYFINNSSRLGVLYVIWFKRIWLPSSGWKAYTRGNGDPSSDHTNHVHLSVI
ncbi:coiled-coil domain-containing protein [Actinoplanes sp. CA-030573]|uniref:coiled-coil domain-containing protein n=1 Tax=Actinoplanes sp. CA-030573 TaxID=3239898 RepID=UPI003D93CB64